MLRAILAVLVGYLVMSLAVFALFWVAYLALGPERVFQPGTYFVSAVWIAASLVVTLLAAVAGGYACAALGGSGAAKGLAGLVLVLGLAFAIPVLDPAKDPRPIAREPNTPNLEAMTNGRQPVWVALSLPFIGAAGALVGASRAKRR